MKKKRSRTKDRKPMPVQPIALQQVQGRAGGEFDLDGVNDPPQVGQEQHNETLVRDGACARPQHTARRERR